MRDSTVPLASGHSGSMTGSWLHDAGFVEALVKSVGVIGASEIGDKTFFIAAIMAMRQNRVTVRWLACTAVWDRQQHRAQRSAASAPTCGWSDPPPTGALMQVFAGALGALAAMTVLSALMGMAAPKLVRTCPDLPARLARAAAPGTVASAWRSMLAACLPLPPPLSPPEGAGSPRARTASPAPGCVERSHGRAFAQGSSYSNSADEKGLLGSLRGCGAPVASASPV